MGRLGDTVVKAAGAPLRAPEGLSLADAEARENAPEQVLGSGRSADRVEGRSGPAQGLRDPVQRHPGSDLLQGLIEPGETPLERLPVAGRELATDSSRRGRLGPPAGSRGSPRRPIGPRRPFGPGRRAGRGSRLASAAKAAED